MSDCSSNHWPAGRYQVRENRYCLFHAVFSNRLLRTSLPLVAVVGTVLTTINQGTVLFDGRFPDALWWKIPMTYTVPFFVSTWSQLRVFRVSTP